MSRCCSLLTRNGPAGGLGVLVWLVTAVTMGFVLSKKAQEGIGAAAGDEIAPSKAWGTNRSRDVPISQLLLNLLAAVTWRTSACFQHLPTLGGSQAWEKIAIAVTP